MSNLTFISF